MVRISNELGIWVLSKRVTLNEGVITVPSSNWLPLNEVFTAEDLMTPRDQLHSIAADNGETPIPSESQQYDVIPVTEKGRIVGVLEKGAGEMQKLSEQWLVSRDTGVPDLLRLFTSTKRKAFLVLHKQEIVGLVSPADLNKLAARIYLYNLIGEMELGLMTLIKDHFEDRQDEFIQYLSSERQEASSTLLQGLEAGNAELDLLQQLYLSDLINIVVKEPALREKLRLASRNQAGKALGGLNELRKRIMHPVKPLLEKVPEDLFSLHERVSRITDLLDQLYP